MARRGKRRKEPAPCRRCGLPAEPTDFELGNQPGRWLGGMCPACRDQKRRERSVATGKKLIDKAETSTVVRDGREFTVLTLPPKRRGGRR